MPAKSKTTKGDLGYDDTFAMSVDSSFKGGRS